MKPEPRQFTRDDPCTKLEIWNCFRGRRGFRKVQVDDARAMIGVNVPRVMEREGRVVIQRTANEDYFVLTDEGRAWLTKGMRAFLKNHPAKVKQARNLPRDFRG